MQCDICVSVIIPVYNSEKYLRECLDSVINQTLKEIEIICVDDGSTDGSLEILREYEQKDSRIKALTQPNINAGTARNHGMRYAKGKYLMFLDSDDYFEPDMVMDCYKALETEHADVVCFSAKKVDMRDGSIIDMPWSLAKKNLPPKKSFAPDEMATTLLNSFQNWPWNKAFRKELIEKWQIRFQEIARTNDMLFTCAALALAEKITVIDHAYAFYRVGTGTSLQQTNYKNPLAFWDAYIETRRFFIDHGIYDQYEQSLLNHIINGMIYNYHSVKDVTASAAIFCIIKYQGESIFHFLEHDQSFYYNQNMLKEYRKIIDGDIWTCKAIVDAKTGIEKTSSIYKIGYVVTWLPRKFIGGIRCYKENGFKYTFIHLLQKMHIVKNNKK